MPGDKTVETCKICQKEFKIISWKHLKYKHQTTIEVYDAMFGKQVHGETVVTAESIAKQVATKMKKGQKPWNYGLTKETSLSVLKYANSRLGENNPCHRITNKKQWRKNVKEAIQARFKDYEHGQTVEELYGDENGAAIRLKQSESAKSREVHGHTGHTHTEETKQRLREITTKRLSETRSKISKPQSLLFERILKALPQFDWGIEVNAGPYCIDIADSKLKIAIEVDGDFYHVNEELGYTLKYPIQIRNKRVEKSKTAFLLKRDWKLIRIWVSDIEKDIDNVINRITDLLNETRN